MKGIILLNRQIYFGSEKGESRLLRDAGELLYFAKEQQIELIKLNPAQLNIYYAIPFALHRDLNKTNATFDCLLIHSASHFEDFQIDYGDYWGDIKSRFALVVEAAHHLQQKPNVSDDEIRESPPIFKI